MTDTTLRTWYDDVPRDPRPFVLLGFAALAVGVLGFGVWGGTAPIAGAVVSPGAFVATGQNRTVQHLEGGVIGQIMIKEGDVVEAGQVLMTLDATAPRAELRRLELRLVRLLASSARLQAEGAEAGEFALPAEVTSRSADPDIAGIVETQGLTFRARRASLQSDIAALTDGINALRQRVDGSLVQLASIGRQLQLIEEELAAKEKLLESGLVRKPEVLAVARARANLQGEVGRLNGEIGDARERIARAEEQILSARKSYVKTAVDQMHDVNAELYDVRERMRSAQRVLDRVTVTAPVRGSVVKLRYHTEGGVIEPGKNILEIVPVDEELVIECRIQPRDIDHVKRGQSASVQLTALNRRTTPAVAGEVIYVSADAVPNEQRGTNGASTTTSGAEVYVARVRLDAKEAAHLGFKPTAGMPAEVFIKTGERTFFEYIVKPIRDSFSRAFRES